MGNDFAKRLLHWHKHINKREMPWKGEKDPYKIWLSEIILQQTRVEQGRSYYEKFIENYPTISQLAKAPDEKVFKLWEGLGYYNRCKNLLFTARYIAKELNGIFPGKYEDILTLKGVGPYTAAAIASFAFNLPHAVVDGNVFRVLSRVFAIDTAIDSTTGKNEFSTLADKVLDKKEPGIYNQAIMDFGATVCKPFAPLCNHCPLQEMCKAYQEGKVNYLPVKEKVLEKKNRWFYYFLFQHNGKILIHQRLMKDIWENLFEFYLAESNEHLHWNEAGVKEWLQEQLGIEQAEIAHISPQFAQQLTHQNVKGQFIKVILPAIPATLAHHEWQSLQQIRQLAFPKFINQYLETGALQASLF